MERADEPVVRALARARAWMDEPDVAAVARGEESGGPVVAVYVEGPPRAGRFPDDLFGVPVIVRSSRGRIRAQPGADERGEAVMEGDAIPPPGRIRAVILDHGGVLTLPSEEVTRSYPERFGMTLAEFRAAVGRASARLRVDLMAEVETGRRSHGDFCREVEAELPAGASLDGFVEAYYEHLQPNRPMIDLAGRLRRAGYRTAVATNAAPDWRPLWRRQVPGIDALFDTAVDSGEVGVRKPDLEVYSLLVDRLGVEPGRCVFVDDKPENCTAAREAGMHAILFTGNEDTVAELLAVLAE